MGEGMNRFLSFLGFGNDDEDEEYDEIEYNKRSYTNEKNNFLEEEEEKVEPFVRRKPKVVPLPNTSQVRVVILQPNSFEQSQEICEHLKEKKSIIVNLEFVDKDVARRIIDFVSGAVYGLDGNISKVSNSIFLIAPYNYEITNEVAREELKNKLGVSWIK